MQKIELGVICKRPDTPSEIIRQGLVEIAEVCQKPITSALVEIWVRDLSDIPAERLCRAFEQLRKTWTSGFLPTPGNVRAAIEQPEAKALQLEMEEEWRRSLRWIQRHYHYDIGISRDAQDLPPRTAHALRAAGGIGWIAECSDAELQWAKKKFLADFQLVSETGRIEHLLADGRAKEILAQLLPTGPMAIPKQIDLPGGDRKRPRGEREENRPLGGCEQ